MNENIHLQVRNKKNEEQKITRITNKRDDKKLVQSQVLLKIYQYI